MLIPSSVGLGMCLQSFYNKVHPRVVFLSYFIYVWFKEKEFVSITNSWSDTDNTRFY